MSVHYIVNLNQKRFDLEEWKQYKELIAEIQVRTILQHSWAAISHELVYKRKEEMPSQLERKLFRLAGLFELADEQFEELKSKDDGIEKEYVEKRGQEIFDDEPLNFLTVKTDLENSKSQLKSIVEGGYSSGFNKSAFDYYKEDISKILLVSRILNISTFAELVAKLKNKSDKLDKTLAEMLGNLSVDAWSGSYGFLVFINLLLSLADEDLQTLDTKIYFAPKLWRITKDAIANNR